MSRRAEIAKSLAVHQSSGAVQGRDVVQLQRRVQDALDPLMRKPHIAGSVLMTDLPLTVGISNRIKHKLGRAWRGYYVVKQDGPAFVWDASASDTDADPAVYLPLAVSATVTVDLVVF